MNCPVCNSHQYEHFGVVKKYTPNLVYYRCVSCESLWQPEPAQNPDDYYQEDYYSGKASFAYYDGRKMFKVDSIVHKARLASIKKFLEEIGNINTLNNKIHFLDVGCAFGSFVRSCAGLGPAYGLDVSRYSVSAGNDWLGREEIFNFRGLKVGSLTHLPNSFTSLRNFFSVITLIEVAEHLYNPRAHFESAYRLLGNKGVLVIQTANFSGWQAMNSGIDYHYLLPGHLTCYSSGGLIKMLKEIGFTHFKEHIPVDFSLWAKLKKAGHRWKWLNLWRMMRISVYHLKSKLRKKGRPLTSSWVLYAVKSENSL